MHSPLLASLADASACESPCGDLDFLWLEVTRKCNLQCIHCYADSSPYLPVAGAMSYRDWHDVLEQGYSLGCRSVQFIGGEPTIYPHLSHLLEDANRIGYTFVEVFTNGTTLNETWIDDFIRNNVQLAFSVYAHEAKTHDSITKTKGSFERTLRGIRLSIAKGIAVRVGVIEMDANATEVEEAKALLSSLGVESVGSDRVRGIGRGHDLVSDSHPFNELCGACWKGKLAIDSDGNAFPCVFSKFCPVGNIRGNLISVVQGDQLHDFRNSMRKRMLAEKRGFGVGPGSNCDPATCYPQTRPCNPDCAPSSETCVPQMRKLNILGN